MNILGSLPKTKTDNRIIVAITDRHFKFTMVIPTRKLTAIKLAQVLVEKWSVPYGISDHLLTESRQNLLESSLMQYESS